MGIIDSLKNLQEILEKTSNAIAEEEEKETDRNYSMLVYDEVGIQINRLYDDIVDLVRECEEKTEEEGMENTILAYVDGPDNIYYKGGESDVRN